MSKTNLIGKLCTRPCKQKLCNEAAVDWALLSCFWVPRIEKITRNNGPRECKKYWIRDPRQKGNELNVVRWKRLWRFCKELWGYYCPNKEQPKTVQNVATKSNSLQFCAAGYLHRVQKRAKMSQMNGGLKWSENAQKCPF